MQVEPKRVKKVDSPLLIIGLGGTGSDALLTIMDKFKQRFILPTDANGETLNAPERTAYLAFDTDKTEMESRKIGTSSFRQENIFPLQIPERLGVGTIPAYITDWWDPKLTGYQIKNGAGGIRQVGRFVLFHNVDGIVRKLETTIKDLISLEKDKSMGTLEIVLTTGISGGTGSGTFLDMAYLIRYVMDHSFPQVAVNFMAYILTPSVNVDKIATITSGKKDMLETTGYAALKELDFWMNYNTHQYPFTQRYSSNVEVKWNTIPFDNVILMSNQKKDGTMIQNAYYNCLDVLSESVLNFYADEAVGTDGQISLRSHLSNISGQMEYLHRKYPANYTYMSVGAAASGDLKDYMITYEAQTTLTRIGELKKTDKVLTEGSLHAAPLLGEREGETFLQKFFPPALDYFGLFANEWTDPGIFYDPTITPKVIHDGPPIQGDLYSDWIHDCDLHAKEFAVREVQNLDRHFKELVMEYVTNLNYGPYETSRFLKDEEGGFVGFFTRLFRMWQGYEDSCLAERNNAQSEVSQILYPKVTNMGGAAQALGMWGPVNAYKDGCIRMFHAERDYALAREITAELRDMQSRVRAYCMTILPTFCNLLDEVNNNLVDDLQLMRNSRVGTSIASADQITGFVDSVFGTVEQDRLATQLLTTMVRESQSIQLNSLGTIDGMEDIRNEFEHATDHFVQEATCTLNGSTMDDVLKIVMPDATQQQKVEYLSQKLLPSLKQAAQTMLPLTVKEESSNEYIPYAYASVPDDAPIIQQGVQAYSATEHITPKLSDVTDRIYWLNTLNCIPMYMFVDVPRLEKVYENSLVNLGAKGLHLVYAPKNGRHELYNDWSLLPSPVVHELQKIQAPGTVQQRHQAIEAMFEKAMASGAIKLDNQAGKEQLKVILRLDESGNIETMDQFDTKLTAVMSEDIGDTEKLARLEELKGEGKEFTIDYTDYSEIFAAANDWSLRADHNTSEELKQVEENRMKARIRAAEYILYSWKPQLAEQMISQQEMHEKINKAMDSLKGVAIPDDFLRGFMGLFLNGVFTFGRMGINFKDVRGGDSMLISKADLTDDELSAFGYCNALVLAKAIFNEDDKRIDPNDRRYLNDSIKRFTADIDRMPEDEYQALVAKAKEFRTEFEKTADAIKYDRGSLSKAVREEMFTLMDRMIRATRIFS